MVVHILTIHWKSDRWIDVQLRYFEKYFPKQKLVYTFLNDIPPGHEHKFFYHSKENIKDHAIKLNILADMACFNATSDNDVLVFIDGDAFPVNDIDKYIEQLRDWPIIAVQRKENFGDIQPHPSFCITTTGFWKKHNCDWKKGYSWKNLNGDEVTDVGGNLLGLLEEKKINWLPILRSNKVDIHPLSYGIYGDTIYHHGAGFRSPISRIDLESKGIRIQSLYFKLLSSLPKRLNIIFNPAQLIAQKNINISELIYQWILSDANFFKALIDKDNHQLPLNLQKKLSLI